MRQGHFVRSCAVFEPPEQPDQFGPQALHANLVSSLLAGGLNAGINFFLGLFHHFFDYAPGEYARPESV